MSVSSAHYLFGYDDLTDSILLPHVVIMGAGASKAAFPQGDRFGNVPPLLNTLGVESGVNELLEAEGYRTDYTDFEAYYSDVIIGKPSLKEKVEDVIKRHFMGFMIPDEMTLYDRLILSLQKKDLIASFNWDPLLLQAYQRNIKHRELPQLVFLHGNVGVAVCTDCHVKGYYGQECQLCGRKLSRCKLLFPVKEKNYSADPFISSEWDLFRWYLRSALIVTIFGYSAPVTDQEARQSIIKSWRDNPALELGQVEIIDIKQKKELKENWEDLFYEDHLWIPDSIEDSFAFDHMRRSCEDFFQAYFMLNPPKECKTPEIVQNENLNDSISARIEMERISKLKRIVILAVADLIKNDSDQINLDVREEAINHRIAVYIENHFNQLFSEQLSIDVEYSKNINQKKTMEGFENGFRPDIVLHQRGSHKKNYLAVEIKKLCNSDKDREKLKKLIGPPYNYLLTSGISLMKDSDSIEFTFMYLDEKSEVKEDVEKMNKQELHKKAELYTSLKYPTKEIKEYRH